LPGPSSSSDGDILFTGDADLRGEGDFDDRVGVAVFGDVESAGEEEEEEKTTGTRESQ